MTLLHRCLLLHSPSTGEGSLKGKVARTKCRGARENRKYAPAVAMKVVQYILRSPVDVTAVVTHPDIIDRSFFLTKPDKEGRLEATKMATTRRHEAWSAVLTVFTLLSVLACHLTREHVDVISMRNDQGGDGNDDMVSARPDVFGGTPAIDDADEAQHDGHHATGGELVLIKSFKTGSTTLATYIAQVGHQRRSYFLHPEATGWFAPGELESRRDTGQRFDVSLRHVTPSTPYGVLEELVPGAAFVTIMRRPVERFLSLFNFRGEIKRKFVALVSAIRTGQVSQGDARPFCNQLAWLMSGRDVDYTGITDPAEVKRVAQEVIEEAEKRGVMVLITERMSESLAVLAHRMQWDTDELELRVGSQRVQGDGPHYLSCSGSNAGNPCTSAIRGCNLIDEVLYDHYERNFEDLVRELPPEKFRRAKTLLDGQPKAKPSMSRLELGKFPVNCVSVKGVDARAKAGLDDGNAPRRPHAGSGGLSAAALSPPPHPSSNESNEDLYRRLHSCEGRPTTSHDRP